MLKKCEKKKLELNVSNSFYTLQNYYSGRFYQNGDKKLIFVSIYILFLILSH